MNAPAVAGNASVCVVHLVWAPLGLEPFRAFLDSYRRHPAGIAHRLLIVFNGFAAAPEIEPYQALLAGLEYSTILLPRPVQDIAAYLRAAEACAEHAVCFLNSYSAILCADWLQKMRASLDDKNRLVGASGTWESMYTDLRHEHRHRRLRWWTPHGVRTRLRYWKSLAVARRHFLPFPNPHLRTNGFLVERVFLLSLGFAEISTKDDAHRFESGREGLTGRARRAGVQPVVVDRDGRAWDPADWPRSRTFRSGAQENLLVSDNRTRDYDAASPAGRRELSLYAWGTEHPV